MGDRMLKKVFIVMDPRTYDNPWNPFERSVSEDLFECYKTWLEARGVICERVNNLYELLEDQKTSAVFLFLSSYCMHDAVEMKKRYPSALVILTSAYDYAKGDPVVDGVQVVEKRYLHQEIVLRCIKEEA